MRHIHVLFICLLCANLYAAPTTSTLKSLQAIESAAADDVGNGGVEILKYDVSKFEMSKEIKKIKDEHKNVSDCKFDVVVGRTQNIEALRQDYITSSTAVADELDKLKKAKKLKTIISAQWDQESGDSEYCSIYDFQIFTTDGYRLVLSIDHTD